MRRLRETFAAIAIGGFAAVTVGSLLGLAIGFVVMLGTAPAELRDIPPVVSNAAAKQDRTGAAVRRTIAVSDVEITGSAGGVVTMRDAGGQVVYHSDPAQRETVVARDALIPTTLRDLQNLFDVRPMADRSDAARVAKIDRDGFLALITAAPR